MVPCIIPNFRKRRLAPGDDIVTTKRISKWTFALILTFGTAGCFEEDDDQTSSDPQNTGAMNGDGDSTGGAEPGAGGGTTTGGAVGDGDGDLGGMGGCIIWGDGDGCGGPGCEDEPPIELKPYPCPVIGGSSGDGDIVVGDGDGIGDGDIGPK